MSEKKAQRDARLALAKRRDNLTFRNQTGQATYYRGGTSCPTCKKKTLNARKYVVPYGLSIGSSDLVSVVPVDVFPPAGNETQGHITIGAAVFIEMKSTTGRHKEDQKDFGELVKSFGGHYDIARSGEDACDIIESVRRLDPWIKQ